MPKTFQNTTSLYESVIFIKNIFIAFKFYSVQAMAENYN